MKQDLNNDNSPLRPERLMKAINANLKMMQLSQQMLVHLQYGLRVT